MENTELRIGNLIHERYYSIQLKMHMLEAIKVKDVLTTHVNDIDDNPYNYEDLRPIPLVEGWMPENNFFEDSFISCMYNVGKLNIYFQDGVAWIDILGDSIEIPFIHTLQNLHFALTSEELTIN